MEQESTALHVELQDTIGAPVEVASVPNGANPAYPPSRTRGLMPPWRPGVSGNPSGLTKDGKSPKAQALAGALQDELMRSGGMEALAKRWVALAKKGNATALASILERLYPVPKDPQQGRQILEGLKLELTPQGASLTMARTESLASGQKPDVDSGLCIEGVAVTQGSVPALPAASPQLEQGSGTAEHAPTPQIDAQGQPEGPS